MKTRTLHSLTAKHFKNLSIDKRLELKHLNIFIGPNASGKSNFIALLKFLKDCVVSGGGSEQFETAVAQLGGSKLLDRAMEPPADVEISYHFALTYYPRLTLDLKLFVGAKNSRVSINQESLSSAPTNPFEERVYFYKYHDGGVGKGVVYFNDALPQRTYHFEPVRDVPNNSLGLAQTPQLLEDSKIPPERTPVYKVGRQLIENITRWHFYNANDMNLHEIRNSEPKLGPGDVYLSPSGHNLALVVENLIQQNLDFEESLNKGMRSILPITRRVRPVRTGLMSLNLEWHYEGFDEPFYLNEMSDGTVRMLCWATILLSPKLPTLLVIDEPELGLHVAWMPVLAEWIKSASQRTQVIICTHSPDLLDHFTDSIENVICFSSENRTHFSLKSLSADRLATQLDEGWKLGDLYRVGDPDVGGWPW